MADGSYRNPTGRLRVGACQTREILADPEAALTCIEDFARQGADHDVHLLLFPECFLQGYLVNQDHISTHALDLGSPEFDAVLRRLEPIEATVVVGVIETERGRYFNTAAVITRGQLTGRYRKTHLMPGETVFDPGDGYPTFVLRGVRYGINICSDTQFRGPAAQVAAQGAQLLLVPAQNMLRRPVAERFKDLHHSMRAERAQETGMWLVSSDVTGMRGESRIAYGPTSVISPRGELVTQVPLLITGMVVAEMG
jgi:predicted amidohydrolase